MAPPLTHGSRTGPIPRLARLLAVLMPLLPLSIAATPAHAAFPGANGRIVFDTADNPDGSQIYTANPDGSDL
jgi:hypothetical protein